MHDAGALGGRDEVCGQDHERSSKFGEVREDWGVAQPDKFAALHLSQWLRELRKATASLRGNPHTFAVR